MRAKRCKLWRVLVLIANVIGWLMLGAYCIADGRLVTYLVCGLSILGAAFYLVLTVVAIRMKPEEYEDDTIRKDT